MDVFERMLQLSSQGFACAQIMMQLVLDGEDKRDPDLVRTLGALNNGLRDCGQLCGALTGGACVISYYAGQGEPDEMPDPAYDAMVGELFDWFNTEVGAVYGGVTCPAILAGNQENKLARCPKIVEDTFAKTIEILAEREIL